MTLRQLPDAGIADSIMIFSCHPFHLIYKPDKALLNTVYCGAASGMRLWSSFALGFCENGIGFRGNISSRIAAS